jgi:hypothetical protein
MEIVFTKSKHYDIFTGKAISDLLIRGIVIGGIPYFSNQ